MEDLQGQQDKVISSMQKQLANMDWSLIDRKATEKKLVDTELKRVQKATQQAARAALGDDKRQAYKGIRVTKYKRIMGGNVNILSPRKGGTYVVASDTARIRNRYRSERSKMMASYAGPSRSFVLRFIEGGTMVRTAGTKYSSKGGSGNRGAITAKSYMSTAQAEMSRAPENLMRQIGLIMDKQFES